MKPQILIFLTAILLFSVQGLADGEVEALSACEPQAEGVFTMMCICAKAKGESVEHKNVSDLMPAPQKYASDKECEQLAEPPCIKLCNEVKW